MITWRYRLAVKLSGRRLRVPIRHCVHFGAFRYGWGEPHPYETFTCLLRGKSGRPAACRWLEEFLQYYRPRNMGEGVGADRVIAAPLWSFPWDPLAQGAGAWVENPAHCPDIVTHFSEQGILRWRIEEEFRWLEGCLESIHRLGYKPRANGGILTRRLVGRDGAESFIVLDGNHRLSALAALGQAEVEVSYQPSATVFEDDIEQWPQVRSGTYTVAEARAIFAAYFAGNRRWRLATEPAPILPAAFHRDESGGARARLKAVARVLIPEKMRRAVRRRWLDLRWEGDHPDWRSAQAASRGYDAPAILARVLHAARQVKRGEADYERDGVAFHGPTPAWPAWPWLLAWAHGNGGALRLLDFGGSLGSLYFQHRASLSGLAEVKWRVVEQPLFARAGAAELADPSLAFFESPEAAERDGRSDGLVLSSVLQYLERPHETMDELLSHRFPLVVMDRTPLITGGRDRLTVQHVPPALGRASYPCWHFNRERLLAHFAPAYILRHEFAAADGELGGASYRGFVFVRKDVLLEHPEDKP
jgi:putative methyltransferase (TIGR04325 family)